MVKYSVETKTDFLEYIITWRNVCFMLLGEKSRLLNPCTLYDTTSTLKNVYTDLCTYRKNKMFARQTPKY